MFVKRSDARADAAKAGYERKRLISASRIPIQRTENPREFFIKSRSKKEHWWPVNLDGDPMCYCEDNQNTTEQCAHVLAARLASGDLPLLQALGNIMFETEKRNKELSRKRRVKPSRTGARSA